MSEFKIVKVKLRRLLEGGTLNWEVDSGKSITKRLEDDLGVNLDAHKALIKEEIDNFLMKQNQQEAAAGEGGEGDEDFEPEHAEAPAPKKQKGASGAAAPTAPPGEFSLPLGRKRFVRLNQFKGKTFVDVREFYEKDGEFKPTGKGASLGADLWAALTQHMGGLSAGLDAQDDSVSFELGGSKRAAVSSFGGRYSVDVREYYEKDGEKKPGKKGIALGPDEWSKLCEAAAELTQRLGPNAGGAGAAAPSAAAAAPGAAGTAATPKPAAATPAAAAAAPGSAEGGAGGGEGGRVELSATRHADVSEFKGKKFVGVREYYEKAGQLLPGKKGISLSAEQFEKLREGAAGLDTALRNKDTAVEVQLSNMRKASISEFKGKWMVNIREYYQKGDQLLPGSKGISLPEEQWGKLYAGMDQLQAALQAA